MTKRDRSSNGSNLSARGQVPWLSPHACKFSHELWVRLVARFTGLLLAASAYAIEDPPGCSQASGGLGNISQGGINFNLSQAHIGDTVPLFPSLGMVSNACKAINATGSVYEI